MSWTTQASYWTPKRTETYENPDRTSKSEAKINISEDEKKVVKIIQTRTEYWSTDVTTNHQVTNQQPNDYKEPINKSEDKVRGHKNSQQIHEQWNGRELHQSKPLYCYLNNGHKSEQQKKMYIPYKLQLIQPSWSGMDAKNTNLLNGRWHRSVGVMKPASVTWHHEKSDTRSLKHWHVIQPTVAIEENQNQW
jgi:hypothetical protein